MAALKQHFLVAAALALTASPALSAPWVRGFVVDNYEPAFYYGGHSGTEEPGSDCPKGTVPILDYKKELKTSWRTQAEIDKLTLPVSAGGEGEKVISPAMTHRGFRRDIDTYVNPFTAPDAGMQQVTGRIAEGFDLDGNANSGGFTSPSGERGYRQCVLSRLGLHHVLPRHALSRLSQPARQRQDAGRPLHHGDPHLGQFRPDE
jgi:hypothetical protein